MTPTANGSHGPSRQWKGRFSRLGRGAAVNHTITMRWFRSHIRLGSRLALFALALQIALCFSHIDKYDLGLTPAKAAPAAAAASDAKAAAKNAPSDRSDQSPDTGCPICALIQLAAASTPSVAPVLPPPVRLAPVTLQASDDSAHVATLHFLFQARAPPAL